MSAPVLFGDVLFEKPNPAFVDLKFSLDFVRQCLGAENYRSPIYSPHNYGGPISVHLREMKPDKDRTCYD